MMAIDELRAWLNNLGPDCGVAIDEGGICLVEVDANGNETGYYIEVGGVPLPEDLEEA